MSMNTECVATRSLSCIRRIIGQGHQSVVNLCIGVDDFDGKPLFDHRLNVVERHLLPIQHAQHIVQSVTFAQT